jgi:hypothetical protein
LVILDGYKLLRLELVSFNSVIFVVFGKLKFVESFSDELSVKILKSGVFVIVEFVIFISTTVIFVTFKDNIDASVIFVVLSTAIVGSVTLLGNVMFDVSLTD